MCCIALVRHLWCCLRCQQRLKAAQLRNVTQIVRSRPRSLLHTVAAGKLRALHLLLFLKQQLQLQLRRQRRRPAPRLCALHGASPPPAPNGEGAEVSP